MKPTKEYKGRSTIRMFNMDCMDFMEDCDTYDLAIVDPPYGLDKKISQGGNEKSKSTVNFHNVYNKGDAWDKAPDEYYFKALFDSSDNQIICGGNYFPEIWNKPIRGIIWWDKHTPVDNFSAGELLWTSFSRPARKFDHMYTNIIDGNNRRQKINHPTAKPISLYKWLLTNYANEGDRILDTHGGSLSIAIACWDLGFDLDIIELDEDYFNDAVKRFETHIAQTQLF